MASGSRARSSSGAPGDARRYVSMLRGEPEVGGTGTLACSFGAWEPGDRGSAPSSFGPWGPKSPMPSARAAPQAQLDALAERFGSVVAGLQRQCDMDKRTCDRRFQQIEKQLQQTVGRLEGDYGRDSDWREKFSLLQGSVTGLADESQALSRRLDSLDERLWSRTSSAEELARQGSRELGSQLQAFERQARLTAAAMEETQKRQNTRQRRAEGMLEDVAARLAQVEDRCGSGATPQTTEIRLQDLETEVSARLQELEVCMNNLQAHHLELVRLAAVEENNFCTTVDEECSEDGFGGTMMQSSNLRGAITVVEDDVKAFERRVSAQLEDLASSVASLRVKADGQTQRQYSLAERLESAHVPALEALQSELMEVRSRDLCDSQGQFKELELKLQQQLDLHLEAFDIEPLHQKLDSLSQRVSSGEATASALRREVHELRGNLDRRGNSKWNSRGGFDVAGPKIQEQLGALADQLEALDELANRVSLLDDRVCGLEKWPLASPPVATNAGQYEEDIKTILIAPDVAMGTRIPQTTAIPQTTVIVPEVVERMTSTEAQLSTGGVGRAGSLAAAQLGSKKQQLDVSYTAADGSSKGVREIRSMQISSDDEVVRSTLCQRRGDNMPARLPSLRSQASQLPEVVVSTASLPKASSNASPTPSAPSLSRKQSLESSLSSEVAIEPDECVGPSSEDALLRRCDVTMEVVSPSQASKCRDTSTMSVERKMLGSSCGSREEADDGFSNGSFHESFEDEDIISRGSDAS